MGSTNECGDAKKKGEENWENMEIFKQLFYFSLLSFYWKYKLYFIKYFEIIFFFSSHYTCLKYIFFFLRNKRRKILYIFIYSPLYWWLWRAPSLILAFFLHFFTFFVFRVHAEISRIIFVLHSQFLIMH